MRQLIICTMLLTTLFSLCLLATTKLGNQFTKPISLQRLGISECGNDLCVATIHARSTSWADARAILSTQSNIYIQANAAVRYDETRLTYFYKDDHSLTNIEIATNTRAGLMQFHELISLLDFPCSLTLINDTLYLHYGALSAKFTLDAYQLNPMLTPQTPIESLYLWAADDSCEALPSTQRNSVFSFNWCGFASLDYYFRHCRKPD